MQLRLAQVNDAPRLAQLHVDTWQAAYRGIVPDAYLAQFTCEKREQAFRRALEAKTEETYLLEENESVVAILTIGASRDADLDHARCGELWGIYIAPAYWRRGLGKAVMCEGLRRLKRMGATKAFVGSYSPEAHALYASVGFVEYELLESWNKVL